jgi:hypothetical protein
MLSSLLADRGTIIKGVRLQLPAKDEAWIMRMLLLMKATLQLMLMLMLV